MRRGDYSILSPQIIPEFLYLTSTGKLLNKKKRNSLVAVYDIKLDISHFPLPTMAPGSH